MTSRRRRFSVREKTWQCKFRGAERRTEETLLPIHCRRSSNSFCSCSRKAPAKAIYAPLFSANGWALWILAHPLRLSFSVSPLIRRRYLWLQAGERRDDLDLPAYVTRGRRVPVHWLCTAATNSGGGGAPVLTSSAMRVHERSSWVVWSAPPLGSPWR